MEFTAPEKHLALRSKDVEAKDSADVPMCNEEEVTLLLTIQNVVSCLTDAQGVKGTMLAQGEWFISNN